MRFFRYLAFVTIVLIGLNYSNKAQADISIAVVGPMSGSFELFGKQLVDGVKFAMNEINANGGLLGERLVLREWDDECKEEKAIEVANAIVQEKINLVVGHFCSETSIATSKIYAEHNIIQISPATTNPKFTDLRAGIGTFRLYGRSDEQGQALVKLIKSEFPDSKLGIIEHKSIYADELLQQVQTAMENEGINEIFYEAVESGQSEYSRLINQLQSREVDLLLFIGYHDSAAQLAKEVADEGLSIQLIAGDALNTSKFWKIAQLAGQGVIFVGPFDPRTLTENSELLETFRESDIEPEGYVLYSFAAVELWSNAVKKGESIDFSVVSALLNQNEFNSVVGPVQFNSKGDWMSPSFVPFRWFDGKATMY